MKFNYKNIFKGSKQRAKAYGLEALNAIMGGGGAVWNASSHLKQYQKSLYVYASVNRIASKVASIDLHLYKIVDKLGNSDELLSHVALDLIAKPNPYQTSTEFLKTAWINKKLAGECFWWKIRNSKGDVVELWNLRPDLVTVVADKNEYISYYSFQKEDGTVEKFLPEDIIHFKDPDPLNEFRGLSPVAVSKYRIQTEEEATLFQKNFFTNNARPDALLMSDDSMDEDQRKQLMTSWEDRHQGKGNQSKLGLLEGGLKYQQISISQREMDYIESMKFTRDDILVAFGVPKSIVTTDDINYANADAGIRMFLSETITPEMKQLVEVLNEMLIVPDFGEDLYLDFTDPTPADRTSLRADSLAGYGRWMTTNEIRALYNLPTVDGGDIIPQLQNPLGAPSVQAGQSELTFTDSVNKRMQQLRRSKTLNILRTRASLRKRFDIIEFVTKELTQTALKLKKKTKTTKKKSMSKSVGVSILNDDTIRQNYYDVTNEKISKRAKPFEKKLLSTFAAQEKRVQEAIAQEFAKAGEKGLTKELSQSKIAKLLNKKKEDKILAEVSVAYLLEFAEEGAKDAAKLIGETFVMTDVLRTAIDKRSEFFASAANDTTFGKLATSLSEGIDAGEGITALSDRVSEIYSEFPTYRADLIARTETTNANNEGALAEYKASKLVEGKEWVATLDSRTRESHSDINGEIVSKEEPFSNGLFWPNEPNCRCVIAPTLSSDAN